jgi:hypothetical protein
LSTAKYKVIKKPQEIGERKSAQYIGKSEKGVSLATLSDDYRLQVFNLVESDGQIDWALEHNVDLKPLTSIMLSDFEGFKKTQTLDGDVDGDVDVTSIMREEEVKKKEKEQEAMAC